MLAALLIVSYCNLDRPKCLPALTRRALLDKSIPAGTYLSDYRIAVGC